MTLGRYLGIGALITAAVLALTLRSPDKSDVLDAYDRAFHAASSASFPQDGAHLGHLVSARSDLSDCLRAEGKNGWPMEPILPSEDASPDEIVQYEKDLAAYNETCASINVAAFEKKVAEALAGRFDCDGDNPVAQCYAKASTNLDLFDCTNSQWNFSFFQSLVEDARLKAEELGVDASAYERGLVDKVYSILGNDDNTVSNLAMFLFPMDNILRGVNVPVKSLYYFSNDSAKDLGMDVAELERSLYDGALEMLQTADEPGSLIVMYSQLELVRMLGRNNGYSYFDDLKPIFESDLKRFEDCSEDISTDEYDPCVYRRAAKIVCGNIAGLLGFDDVAARYRDL
ncbi:hypothetical protein HN419_03020 [Candidatus Woesearchaeota archaeon]|jgi:hypothetical protein|nr:hypothetical protein [Candidatus Woesearchaeota archaeon]MBT3537030.1 hypothetical protein [Candidatus Woesearchaeota archaeon]MBT4697640.1 hypothetical protein [Candidatus Woesearchaeota archaeon]MBT4716901.1 hypothetical protein [Candidatus Woesearchaeota archaeon]MBT7106660.1 hypothetical protein [Candidatus Woesearchaeota archaeon]